MRESQIRLLQLFICKDFETQEQDAYVGQAIQSNMTVSEFPFHFDKLYLVTCWRKDNRFHKEVIEYEKENGQTFRTPHMDIEPLRDSVLFRWHKHPFPTELVIEQPTFLVIRVIIDGQTQFETCLLIEKKP